MRNAGGRSVLSSELRRPLRVQKALYPEGDAPCHAVVLHPPGGIAGSDALEIRVDVEPGADALVTTPGAAKWYKANGSAASQNVRLDVAGALEWLLQRKRSSTTLRTADRQSTSAPTSTSCATTPSASAAGDLTR
jgi:urease accessory protein